MEYSVHTSKYIDMVTKHDAEIFHEQVQTEKRSGYLMANPRFGECHIWDCTHNSTCEDLRSFTRNEVQNLPLSKYMYGMRLEPRYIIVGF